MSDGFYEGRVEVTAAVKEDEWVMQIFKSEWAASIGLTEDRSARPCCSLCCVSRKNRLQRCDVWWWRGSVLPLDWGRKWFAGIGRQ